MRQNKKDGTIRGKIACIVLSVSILALVLSAVVAVIGIQVAKRNMIQSSESLGNTAAADSEQALVDQAKDNLISQAGAKADLTEQRLNRIKAQVSLMAGYIGPIYARQVVIEDSRPQQDGDWVMQYARVNDVTDEQLEEEIARTKHAFYVLQPLCSQNKENISSVYFASNEGYMFSYDPNSSDDFRTLFMEGYDPRERDWFTRALETGGPVFTETYLDVFGRLLVTCAAPVYDTAGHAVGVFGMDILIEDINTSIVDAEVGENGYAFLINYDGVVISSPKLQVGEDGNYETVMLRDEPGFAEIADEMTSGQSGFHETDGDEPLFVSYAPVATAGWSIGMVLPRDEVVAPAVATRDHIITQTGEATAAVSHMIAMTLAFFLIAMIVIVVIVLLATNVLSRRITEPILALTDSAKIIGSGNLDHTVSVHTRDELEVLGDTLNHMTVSLKEYMNNLAAITADRERIAAELGVATTIQASMLPCIFPAFPEREEFNIFADMHPAKEVGGDFYDFFLTDPDHLWVVIADVSGKGVPAALFMVIAKTLLKNYAAFTEIPGDVLTQVNAQLCENNDAGMFVTTFIGVLEISTGKFTFSNAGHNAPLLYRAGGEYAWLKTEPGFVLAGLDGMMYGNHETVLKKGDRLFLYTDGVTEALNRKEELYGDDRLLHTLNAENVKPLAIEQIVQTVKDDIHQFADGAEQADDITMLALEIC